MTSSPSSALSYDGRPLGDLRSSRIEVDVGGHRVEFLDWGFYEPRPWRNYLHTHSFFEICYAHSGSGVFRSGGVEYRLGPGDLFVARPGDLHEIVAADSDPLSIHFWSYTLVPSPQSAEDDHHGRELLRAFAESPAVLLTDRGAGSRIPALLELLTAEAARRAPGFTEVVRALAGTLVVETARSIVGPEMDPAAPDASPETERNAATVRTMVRYLQDNYDRPVSVRDVVAQVHVSERHGNRLFRAVEGTTIHAYLARFRLEVAAQRLLERGISVKEVARSCGYPDVRHFSTAFRQHWGVPPAAFRAARGTTHLERGTDR
ncbi:MAG TPA: AraC family transcriptional regulator [Actinopolymorphaceae bacterium]